MKRGKKSHARPLDRAIAYLRVSTSEQHLGPEAQRAAIETWAHRSGVKVLEWHLDQGVSGTTPIDKRPGLIQSLQAVSVRHAGLLVVAKRDRLARSVIVAATVEHMARRAGARIVSADGTSNAEGPEGELMRGIIDAFAAYERAMIAARTKAALGAKKKRGELVGAVPFGFEVVDGKLVPLEREQRAIARIDELGAAGESVRAIARTLERERFRPRGSRWHATTVQRILVRDE